MAEDAPPLRDLFHARYEEIHIPEIMNELKGSSDRTVAIILSSMIERNLEQLIIAKISMGTEISKTRLDTLFDRDGPLSSFSGNIRLAFALSLFRDRVRRDLDTIRRVRNLFAHSALPITFADSELKAEIGKLRRARYDGIMFDEITFEELSEERREFILSSIQLLEDISDALTSVIADLDTIAGALALRASLRDKSE